jgi:hypothetical protein
MEVVSRPVEAGGVVTFEMDFVTNPTICPPETPSDRASHIRRRAVGLATDACDADCEAAEVAVTTASVTAFFSRRRENANAAISEFRDWLARQLDNAGDTFDTSGPTRGIFIQVWGHALVLLLVAKADKLGKCSGEACWDTAYPLPGGVGLLRAGEYEQLVRGAAASSTSLQQRHVASTRACCDQHGARHKSHITCNYLVGASILIVGAKHSGAEDLAIPEHVAGLLYCSLCSPERRWLAGWRLGWHKQVPVPFRR